MVTGQVGADSVGNEETLARTLRATDVAVDDVLTGFYLAAEEDESTAEAGQRVSHTSSWHHERGTFTVRLFAADAARLAEACRALQAESRLAYCDLRVRVRR